MPRPEPTPIIVNASGDETHESWLLGHASRVSSTPGARLFDSEIPHSHYITLSFSTVSRKRDLHHDWLHPGKEIIEVAMSEAQWGALVSSFGNGSGVPVTLEHHGGQLIPRPTTIDSRLDVSHQEVKNKASEGMAKVKAAQKAVDEAFERGAGKKEMRQLLRNLHFAVDQMPGNMEFAAKSMTEHAENVITKARSDIEAMALRAMQTGQTEIESPFGPAITGTAWDAEVGARRRADETLDSRLDVYGCESEHGVGHDTCPKCWNRKRREGLV